jgi:hypothetical protein
LLPRSQESTASAWQNYLEAQTTFDKIIPGATTAPQLRTMSLDPASNPNIAVLNYSDVLRRFMLNQSLSLSDLDGGVRDCVMAKTACHGYEIHQKVVKKHRNGNFFLDLFGFSRETQTQGWRFSGLILLKEGVVIYKLTGGEPVILQQEENHNPLGPVQAIGSKLFGWF